MDPFGPTLRRTRRRERPGWRALVAVVLSLALNALVVTQLDASWLLGHKAGPRREVAIAPLTARDWEANRRVGPSAPPSRFPPPPAPAQKPPEPPREEVVQPGQLVQLDDSPSAKREVPKDSKYISDRDQVVEKQTKARLNPNADGLNRPQQAAVPPPVIGSGGRDAVSNPGAPGSKGAKTPEPARPERVARASADRQETPGRGELPRPATAWSPAPAPVTPGGGGEGGSAAMGAPDHRLDLHPATVAKVLGRPVGDKLDDVEEGDGNFLSTRSWKYATYFNRIKEAVGQAWRPNKEIQRRDPDGSLYFYKDRLTVLSVTLDQTGALKDVRVVRPSNVDFLDKVAVEAFQKAQPFTNPPAGLVNERGEIQYTLGFEVYGARPGLHLFKGSYAP